MSKEVRKYWSPVWGKVVGGVSFDRGSERGGGMVVTSCQETIRNIERSKAFRQGRVVRIDDDVDVNLSVDADNDNDAGIDNGNDAGNGERVFEEVVGFQQAREVVMNEMRERGEELKLLKSKAEVRAEAGRLGIGFPNLR